MAIKFNRSQTFATNGTVTAAGLHNLIDGTDIYQALITDQTNLTSVGSGDELLIADADLTAGDAPRAVTVFELFNDAFTISTYTDLNLSGSLSFGTATGNRTVSTTATISTATIPNLTAGTTTSTVATIPSLTAGTTTSTAASITNGTVQTLTASTATITVGTFSGSINSTVGTIGTLNSTTGTITNLSTTLAGDVTISSGTATVSTRVAVVNTAQEYTATHNFNATSLTISTGSTIAWDLSANQVAKLEVTTNSTLSTPTNPVDGATYMLVVTQGTAGNNTLSFSTAYKFPGGSAPVLSTGSADVDVLAFVSNGTVLYGVTSQDFS
jgi:hypothetical protein